MVETKIKEGGTEPPLGWEETTSRWKQDWDRSRSCSQRIIFFYKRYKTFGKTAVCAIWRVFNKNNSTNTDEI
ncbi:hypothetical protein SK128_000040 [Halocaridina rubra]|uniref:Uncharacterized protein n=1 Tax=Halocaridina rubra TaxID=373956 RepID=A0AAN9A2Y6_HALRR